MNTAPDHQPGKTSPQQNTSTSPSSGNEQDNPQISQPNTERPEGPFEHSGETSGWTEEERKENLEQDKEG